MPEVIPAACANWAPGSAICKEQGKFVCANCSLVMYCGKACQTAHWVTHKVVCKSPLSKLSWRPAWDCEARDPAWARAEPRSNFHNPYGGAMHLWGNVPAIDVLRLPDNEGIAYNEKIELLFAASGDLRNVVKTIADLPPTATNGIHVTINDRGFPVVARNVILLLFALNTPNIASTDNNCPLDTAEALLHLWYSAFIPMEVLSVMHNVIKPLISNVCVGIASEDSASRLEKTLQLPSGRSLRLVLTRDQWLKLERMLDIPQDLTYTKAIEIRHAVVLAPERADYRDRWAFKEPTPFTRIAKNRFREDGLLLPFGHPRGGFSNPNITLFQDSGSWLMDDKSDPLDGWPVWNVLHYPSPLKEDCYGKLFAYLRGVLRQFLDRLVTADVSFEMHCLDARELQNCLDRDKYTRIEVSNISDGGYVGIRDTLVSLSPLLQSPQRNPYATLITLFLNAVMEMVKRTGANEMSTTKIMEYLPATDFAAFMNPQGAELTRMWDARTFFLDVDLFFDLYRQNRNFNAISSDLGVAEKESNTIVEKWPMRLKLQPGQEKAQEEFNVMLGSNFSGMERYVEWKRVA